MLYKGKDIRTLDGLKAFKADAEQVFNYLWARREKKEAGGALKAGSPSNWLVGRAKAASLTHLAQHTLHHCRL